MQPGDIINHTYRILNPIGHGGIGTIYLAYHENLRKYVVVKKIHDRFTSLVNCRSEVDILKELHHPFLPQVYDFVELGDGIFTVMDYIPGHDLKYYIDAGWQFDEERLCLWLTQLCQVLDYLHSQEHKIIHCDIKPANIMITENGNVCLIDFNISLAGENNKDLVGVSSQYASPEQIQKAQLMMRGLDSSRIIIDERSDLYSLGGVFYRLMSGLMPQERREKQIRLKDMELPYKSSLVNIIDKCMMTDPARRFKSARDILDALDHRERWSRQWRRLTWISRAADGIFFAVAVLSVCLMIVGGRRDRQEAFFQACEAYMDQAQVLYSPSGDEDSLGTFYRDGIALLNDRDYRKLFDRYDEEKANILYCVAQASMGMEDYSNAITYLEEAVQLDGDNEDMYRDLAICQAFVQDYEGAKDSLALAAGLGLSQGERALVEGQMAYMQGDYASAYALAVEAALKSSGDENWRAAVLAVTACETLGNYEEGLDFVMETAGQARGASRYLWLQKGGELCVIAVEARGGALATEENRTLVEKGISCYETLLENGYESMTDMYNLVYLYEADGQLTRCRDLLAEMAAMYPEAYPVCVQQAYIAYRIENDRPAGQRDYSKVVTYYDRAVDLCQAASENPSQDPDLVQLESIIEDLRQKGWLAQE